MCARLAESATPAHDLQKVYETLTSSAAAEHMLLPVLRDRPRSTSPRTNAICGRDGSQALFEEICHPRIPYTHI